jgi:hypothetical protein
MAEQDQDGRGFASPPDDLQSRIGGPVRAWFLLHASRRAVTLTLVAITFVSLVAATLLPGVDLVGAMQSADPVATLFQALVGSIITGVTIVVTIAQLVLSQELGPLRDQRQRMDGAMDFRDRVEELLGIPAAPPEPSAFLRAMTEKIDEHARLLGQTARRQLDGDEVDDRPAWEEVADFADLVTAITSDVAEDLDGAQFGTFAVVAGSLNLNYSWRLYVGRRLFNDPDSPLQDDQHEDVRDRLERLLELLALFAPAREHIKTLYFEWELINLSRRILVAGGPALLVSVAALLLLDSPAPPLGSTLGVSNAAWFVSAAATVAISPFALLTSYILRIVTVAKMTLAAGPFILRRTNRQHEIDWGP